jgi:Ca2+-binding EF-hand superfamily protein
MPTVADRESKGYLKWRETQQLLSFICLDSSLDEIEKMLQTFDADNSGLFCQVSLNQ